jgi:hypothetical protein
MRLPEVAPSAVAQRQLMSSLTLINCGGKGSAMGLRSPHEASAKNRVHRTRNAVVEMVSAEDQKPSVVKK